jgi:hypothetical protein
MDLTEEELLLIKTLRSIARTEVESVLAKHMVEHHNTVAHPTKVEQPKAPLLHNLCGVPGPGGKVCLRQALHPEKNHRYGTPPKSPHIPPQRGWIKIEHFSTTSGSRTYVINVGDSVKVTKTGKKTGKNPEGATTDGWAVLGIERNIETGKINVEVRKTRGTPSRTFCSDRILYQRQIRVVRS